MGGATTREQSISNFRFAGYNQNLWLSDRSYEWYIRSDGTCCDGVYETAAKAFRSFSYSARASNASPVSFPLIRVPGAAGRGATGEFPHYAAAAGGGAARGGAEEQAAGRRRNFPASGPGGTCEARSDHKAGCPVCDHEQFLRYSGLHAGAGFSRAAGCAGAGARQSPAEGSGIRPDHSRRVSSVVCDQNLLGRDTG